MSKGENTDLAEGFLRRVGASGGVSIEPTLSNFCDWIRQQSVNLPSDEYLISTSNVLLDLCVKLKISKTLGSSRCSRMAGNIYEVSHDLRDATEEWKVVVREKDVRETRERIRKTQDTLIDALSNFDALCSWAEFEGWLSQQAGRPIHRGGEMQNEGIKGKVDFAIITIKPEEFKAVLSRLKKKTVVKGAERWYSVSEVKAANKASYVVAVARTNEQGTGEAQTLAHDIISDLDPNWILVVGIAGAVPASEFTLGDVVLSTKIYDYSLRAVKEGRPTEYAVAIGAGNKEVINLVTFLPAVESTLGKWNNAPVLKQKRPRAEVLQDMSNVYGSPAWKKKVAGSITRHFGAGVPPRPPLWISGPIISSDALVKETGTLQQWLMSSRDALAVEMEAAGIYRAADRKYPFLAVRGISDIVGFDRDPAWTEYACQSAAAFALAFIKSGLIESRGGQAPPLSSGQQKKN